MPMKDRNLPKPTLDGMQPVGSPLGNTTPQNPFGGERHYLPAPEDAKKAPQVLAPTGHLGAGSGSVGTAAGPHLSVGDPHRSSGRPPAPGVGRPVPAPLSHSTPGVTPMQSYMVSDSGGMLTLGNQYHVSSSGVHEFRGGTVNSTTASTVLRMGDTASYQLGLAANATSSSHVKCTHVSELDFDNGVQIGRGSSGKVYDVLHLPSGLRVCVKQMLIDDARHREEIKRELDSLHKTSSRFIVDFYGAFFHNDLGVILLVLELMEGSLLEVLRYKKRLTELQTKAFALQVVHGLQFLHSERHLIHRDIKPANLLFHRSGQVKITDFGVSTGQRSQDPQSVHTFVGSILYMSPERLEAKSYGYDCDIWSLGITLCEAVTGHHPYQEDFSQQAEPLTFWGLLQKVLQADPERHRAPLHSLVHRIPKENRPTVSHEMDDFVASCLAFDKSERKSAEELLRHSWLASMRLDESERIVREVATEVAALRGAANNASATAVANLEKVGTQPVLLSDNGMNTSAQFFSTSSNSKQSSGGGSGSGSSTRNQQHSSVATPAEPGGGKKNHHQHPQATHSAGPSSEGTPSSLTPEEKRMKSDALLNELLSSVKK